MWFAPLNNFESLCFLQTRKHVAVEADTEGKIQPIDSGLAVFPCLSQNHKNGFWFRG